MKVIGAGLPRTATTTQMFALEQLGPSAPATTCATCSPTSRPGLPLWEAAAEGSPDWDRIFGCDAVDGGLALGAVLSAS